MSKKIFIIEDDIFLSDIIARKLAVEGWELSHSLEGERAIQEAEEKQPDVIILDLVLPGLDGFDILKKLKENQRTKNIPVIVLSNLNKKEDIAKAMKLAASSFLVKADVSLDDIVSEMKKVGGSVV